MTDQPDIREQLAAFLAGDLDGPAAAALQDRIDAEPWVAGLADEMADLLVELGGIDDIDPPAGFSAALREGLEAEIGHALPGVADRPADLGGGHVTTLPATGPRGRHDASRPRAAAGGRARRALSIAAVLAVLGVGTVGVLTSFGGFDGSADQSADVADSDDSGFAAADAARTGEESVALEAEALAGDAAADEDARGDAAVSAPAGAATAAPTAGDDAEEGGEATEEAEIGGASDAPAVIVLGPVDGEQALLDAVAAQPVVDAVIGRPAAAVRELAAAYRDELLRGPAFADGTPPGACLTEVLDAAGDDLVPVVALRADLPDGPVIAYALATSREGQADGAVLDGVDVWVLQPDGCATRQVLRER